MRRKCLAVAAVAAGVALVAGCGGGGGGGGSSRSRTAVFDATTGEAGVAAFGDAMIACSPAATTKAPVSLGKSIAFARSLPRELFAFDTIRNYSGSDTASGDCTYNSIGSVGVSFSHSSGVTTYNFTYDDYCRKDADSGNETIFNGGSKMTQNGTPTNSGPLYKGIDFKTTGSNGINAKTYGPSAPRVGSMFVTPIDTLVREVNIEIGNYSIDFGRPSTWSPYVPVEGFGDPDVDKISNLVITNVDTGDKLKIDDFRAETYNVGADAEVTITDGWVTHSELGTFTVETPSDDPLIVDDSGRVTSGSLVATGKSGATITVQGNGEGNFTVEVVDKDDVVTPLGTELECVYMSRWPSGLLDFSEND